MRALGWLVGRGWRAVAGGPDAGRGRRCGGAGAVSVAVAVAGAVAVAVAVRGWLGPWHGAVAVRGWLTFDGASASE